MSNDPDYGEGPSTRRNLRQRPQRPQRKTSDVNYDNSSTDQDKKRKGKKKACYFGKSSAYDEFGNIRHNGLDVCDCMNEECEGCWYECRSCGSTRCGPQCRSNRKFFYESIIYDGKDLVINNKQFPRK